jgi:hypothetical protein
METIMYMVGYDHQFQEQCRSGWGCGYVGIPVGHPYIAKLVDNMAGYPDEEGNIWLDSYPDIAEFSEEFTYSEWRSINGIKYWVLGFDTAHIYNNKENNFEWVFNKTLELKNIIDQYVLHLLEQ